MLRGFENVTFELTVNEKAILAPMILSKLICHRGRQNAIKNRELIEYCACRGQKVLEPRIRKIIEFLRQKNLVEGLVARQYGYFIAETPDEILSWVNTMKARRNAIDHSINSAMRTVKKMQKRKVQFLL